MRSVLTYAKLKSEFREMGEEQFSRPYQASRSLRLRAIKALADHKNDNGWPLGILKALNEELSEALADWSAGGYEDVRKDQEANNVLPGSTADKLERNFDDLPLWKEHATHYSKVSTLYERLKNGGGFELRAFMSCCAPGYTPAEVAHPRSTLLFTKLKSARLVGALSTTSLEHEVMLPAGSRFEVVSVDEITRLIKLKELDP